MNNEQKINDFISRMPENITSRQKQELFRTIKDAIKDDSKEVKINISDNYQILTAEIKEGNKTTTQTIDIKKMIPKPKKKNKFIEWLNN